jgi:4'-phosphopantetheinyl transferase
VIDGAVDIWVAHLDEVAGEMDRLRSLLDPAEVERAARFRSDIARRRFTARRATRRLLLGSYLEQPPQDIVVFGADGQKPQVAGFQPRDLYFNESASDELAVFAVARGMEVGIDVERIRPIPDAMGIVGRYGSATEMASYQLVPEHDRDLAFLRWWTAKEAFVKMIGTGLDYPLDSFSVSFPLLKETPTLPSPESGGGELELTELTPAPGYVATVIAAGQPPRIRQRRWNPNGHIDAEGAA